MSDRLLGGVVLVLALAFVVGASQIQAALVFDPLGPQTFPIIIGITLAVSAGYPLLRPDPNPEWPKGRSLLEIVFALGILILYAQLLTSLGFVIATLLAAGLLSWRLGARARSAPVIGVSIAVGIYAVFHWVFGLSLPYGVWTVDLLTAVGLWQPINAALVWTGTLIGDAAGWAQGVLGL